MLPLPAAIAWVFTCSVPDMSWGRIGITSGAGVPIGDVVSMRPTIVPVVEKTWWCWSKGHLSSGSHKTLDPVSSVADTPVLALLGNFADLLGNNFLGLLRRVLRRVLGLGHGLDNLAGGIHMVPVVGRWAVADIGAVLGMLALEYGRHRWLGVGRWVVLVGGR